MQHTLSNRVRLAGFLAAVLFGLMAAFLPQVTQAAVSAQEAFFRIGGPGYTVDEIVIEVSGTSETCVFDENDWSIDNAGSINVTDITGMRCESAGVANFMDTHVVLEVEAQNEGTSAGVLPQISYTNNGNVVTEPFGTVFGGTDEMSSFSGLTVEDGQPPKLEMLQTDDTNHSGSVDQVNMAFSEPITTSGNLFSVFQVNNSNCQIKDIIPASNGLEFIMTNCDTGTGLRFEMEFTGTNEIQDATGNAFLADRWKVNDGATPIVTSTNPLDNDTDVAINRIIEVSFSEGLDTSASESGIVLEDSGGSSVPVDMTWIPGDDAIELTPTSDLDYSETYTIAIEDLVDDSPQQNQQVNPFSASFTTEDDPNAQSNQNNQNQNNQTNNNTQQNNQSNTGFLTRSQANSQLPAGISVDDLVKLPNDGDPTTYSDTSVYYIGLDGKRHPFWNDDIFLTWYDDFSEVEEIDGQTMADIPLGKPILVRPGTHWVKIQSVPKTYYVAPDGYTLRWIKDEQTAELLGGNDWNQNIIDVPSTLFTMFNFGQDLDVNTLQNGDWPAGSLLEDGNGDTWYISENGEKRKIESSQAMNANRFQSRFVEEPSNSAWTNLPTGNPIQNFEDKLFSEEAPLL
jgi:hypothetical protein